MYEKYIYLISRYIGHRRPVKNLYRILSFLRTYDSCYGGEVPQKQGTLCNSITYILPYTYIFFTIGSLNPMIV